MSLQKVKSFANLMPMRSFIPFEYISYAGLRMFLKVR